MPDEVDEMTDAPPAGGGDRAGRVLSLARALLAKGGALESTAASETIDRGRLAEALERRIEQNAASRGLAPPDARAVAAEVVSGAESALNKTAGGAPPSNLTDLEVAALEAVIEVTGRPAMRYSNGLVQMPPADLGDNDRWRVLIATVRSKINRASASVGRVSFVGPSGAVEHSGTGWRTAGDLVVTNRHVARELMVQPDAPPASWRIDASKRPHIDFAATDAAAAAQRFEIAELFYCAEEGDFDVAFLRVTSGAEALPPPLNLDWSPEALGSEGAGEAAPRFRGREVYVVGHPYRRRGSELTASVFGQADGGKRWSPGLVTDLPAGKPFLEHDCSTLGGNSGSCVLTAAGHAVVGIHFAGLDVDEETGRGRANRALALARLGEPRAAAILRGEL